MWRCLTIVCWCCLSPGLVRAQSQKLNEQPVPPAAAKLAPGDHRLVIEFDQRKRYADVHVPSRYEHAKPTALVLALHGAAMTGDMMSDFTGLNATAEDKGFIVVYPDGTGLGPLFTWNAGGFVRGVGTRVDDVGFMHKLLDELMQLLNIDSKRVFATGMSNGGMMCYRLAAEMPERIAAIAPVGGSMPEADARPTKTVSVIHFHGTRDAIVPYDIRAGKSAPLLTLRSVEDSVRTWAILNGITEDPQPHEVISNPGDELPVTRQRFGPGPDGSEVVLIRVEGGGHTWPGMAPPVKFLGKSTLNVSANELMWAFFEKHPRP